MQPIINAVLLFFTIPVFIKSLGTEKYGVFSLVLVIGSLNTFTNLGLNNALLKFIAQQGNTKESSVDIIVAVIITLIVVIPFTTLAIIFKYPIISTILSVPSDSIQLASDLFIWVLFANALLMMGQVFKSILDGLQKIYLTSLQQILYNFFYWGLILLVLLLGFSLDGVGVAVFISAFIWFTITAYSSLKIWGKISFQGISKHVRASAEKQLKYGLKIYTSGLISFLYEPLTKILTSHFLGLSSVAFYDIALRLRWQFWGVMSKLFYPLFPFVAEQKDFYKLKKYIHDIEQKTFLLILPVVILVIILMPPFISLWIGENVEKISIASIFIISGHLLFSSTVIPFYQFLMAKNHEEKTIILQFSNVFFNAMLFLVSVYFIDYYALVVGNIAGILSSFIIIIYLQKKYLNSLIFDSLLQIIKFIMVFVILLFFGYLFKLILPLSDLLILIFLPITVFLLVTILYKKFNLIKADDIVRYFGQNNKATELLIKFYK